MIHYSKLAILVDNYQRFDEFTFLIEKGERMN